MKIILSRKGFDSSAGGIANPILPDGTMLSMPIPGGNDEIYSYKDLNFNSEKYNINYADLLNQLSKKKKDWKNENCHLDPDIRAGLRDVDENWKPAFGQIGAAQTILTNASVEKDDLFLFFGWFKQTKCENDEFKYVKKRKKDNLNFYEYADLHAIYGYLQVGEILTGEEVKGFCWHPHSNSSYDGISNNTIYVASEKLTLPNVEIDLPGAGVLSFREDRVLTAKGKSKANWNYKDSFDPDKLINQNRKNSAKGDGLLYYAGQWQELVFNATDDMIAWAKNIILENPDKQ